MNTVLVSRSASMHADKIVLLNIVPSTSAIRSSLIGPLQLVIHVVQNRHGGEQQTHRDKKNKELTSWFTINKSVPLFVCSQCFSCSPAWRALTTWIRGGSRASDKKISGGFGGGGGRRSQNKFFRLFGPQFGLKIREGPSPWSVTVNDYLQWAYFCYFPAENFNLRLPNMFVADQMSKKSLRLYMNSVL